MIYGNATLSARTVCPRLMVRAVALRAEADKPVYTSTTLLEG
jgi:hypothetical protein